MVNTQRERHPQSLDPIFLAIADASRRDMLQRLQTGPHTVGELATPLPMSLAAAAKHVQVLERAGLVHKVADGRRRVCTLEPNGLRAAHAWISRYERFWDNRLDALEFELTRQDPADASGRAPIDGEADDG